MQTLTHTFVREHTKIGPFLSEIRSGEDHEVENLGLRSKGMSIRFFDIKVSEFPSGQINRLMIQLLFLSY